MMESGDKISDLRKKIFLTAYRAGAAHLASSFSVIDLLYVIYGRNFVTVDKINPWKADRTRLILSKGHAALAKYVVLNEIGAISDDELAGFSRPGSHLGGEPLLGAAPGIEESTGSLGRGLSFAVGIAMASKYRGYQNKIYVVMGDGECQEGSVWEAAMSAIKYKLDNLIIIIDDNRLQAMDSVEKVMDITDWAEKWQSFGYDVEEINGHDAEEIESCLSQNGSSGKPRLIISHTIKGHGISFMENVPIWHYRMPNEEEMEIVKKELHISEEELVK
ncbi:transketolase [Lachnospiraceae bacterium 47-T17]